MDYSPRGHKESDTIEQLTLSLFTFKRHQILEHVNSHLT